MAKIIVHEERCKGCGLCVKFCPKGALSQPGRLNKTSYPVSVVDLEKCVCCGTCYTICPDYVFEFEEEEGA